MEVAFKELRITLKRRPLTLNPKLKGSRNMDGVEGCGSSQLRVKRNSHIVKHPHNEETVFGTYKNLLPWGADSDAHGEFLTQVRAPKSRLHNDSCKSSGIGVSC